MGTFAQAFPDASASLAQLVEQLTLNQFVSGSSPERGTSFFKPKQGLQALSINELRASIP